MIGDSANDVAAARAAGSKVIVVTFGYTPIPPRELNTGPVFENVDEGDAVNILKFPAPHWHQGDGGAYIGTECLVITKDPDS